MDLFRENKIIQAWLVLTLALVFGTLLAEVQLTLGPKIEENKRNETYEKIPALILGKDLADKMAAENQTLDIKPDTVGIEKFGHKLFYSIYSAFYDGTLKGWAIKTNGQGYAGRIELLIGMNPTLDKITGLFVLEQKETPGLGNKIITDEWRRQFISIPSQPHLTVIKGNPGASNEIQAITGATISSKSVAQIINTAIGDLKNPLYETSIKDN